MTHFADVLFIPVIIGMQGKASLLFDNEVTTLCL